MFRGFVLSESLKNPVVLNEFRTTFRRVERHPESKEFPFWHLFKIEFDDQNIEKSMERISRELKHGWYAHFWNGKTVYIVFPGKVFRVPQEKTWSSKEYLKAKEYGMKNGVEEEYLDFLIDD